MYKYKGVPDNRLPVIYDVAQKPKLKKDSDKSQKCSPQDKYLLETMLILWK